MLINSQNIKHAKKFVLFKAHMRVFFLREEKIIIIIIRKNIYMYIERTGCFSYLINKYIYEAEQEGYYSRIFF